MNLISRFVIKYNRLYIIILCKDNINNLSIICGYNAINIAVFKFYNNYKNCSILSFIEKNNFNFHFMTYNS